MSAVQAEPIDSTSCPVGCQSPEYTECSLSAKRVQSHLSIISLDAYSGCIDEDDSQASDDEVFQNVRKKARRSKKSVCFVDMNSCPRPKPLEVVSVSDNVDVDVENLYWSREDLARFHMEAKIMYATDADVRDYVDAYHKARDRFVKADTHASSRLFRNEFHAFVEGLNDGFRGLESFSSSQMIRLREVRKIVKAVVASQKLSNFAEIACSFSVGSVAWAKAMGQADDLVTRMDSGTSASMLHDVFV